MRKLQKSYTTPEQSKRLLELGLPADSADCYYNQFSELGFRCEEDYSYDFFDENFMFIPCWSVGRLIEIFVIVRDYGDGFMSIDGRNSIKYLIKLFAMNRNEKFKLDFSKLEE